MQFMRPHPNTHTRTRILGHTDAQSQTNNAYDGNKQTGVQVFSCHSLYSPKHRYRHTLPHRKLSFVLVKKQVAYSSFSSFQRGNGRVHERSLNKSDLGEPDLGLICQRSAVYRGCNALTPIDCRRVEGEHFKC